MQAQKEILRKKYIMKVGGGNDGEKKIIRSLFLTIIFDVTTEGQGTFFSTVQTVFPELETKRLFFSNITEKSVNKETSSLLRSSSYVNRWARFFGTKGLNRFKLGWFIVVLQILQRPGLSQTEKKNVSTVPSNMFHLYMV